MYLKQVFTRYPVFIQTLALSISILASSFMHISKSAIKHLQTELNYLDAHVNNSKNNSYSAISYY